MHIQPPSVLLIGATGSGKTYSLKTLLEAGQEVFVVCTEPTGMDSLLDAVTASKLDINKLHWAVHTPARGNIGGLQKIAQIVSGGTFETIAKLPPMGERNKAQFMQLLSTLSDFKCDRDGKAYGDVTQFGPGKVLVLDSLSGLNVMAMDLVIGDKPSAHQGEWGVAMNMIEKLLNTLTSALKCMFVCTAHLEREVDEITGAQRVMASTLGRKLAPKIPRFFSEVVLARRLGTEYYWSNADTQTDLKRRSLPVGDKLLPSFYPIVEAYAKRVTAAKGGQPLTKLTVEHA